MELALNRRRARTKTVPLLRVCRRQLDIDDCNVGMLQGHDPGELLGIIDLADDLEADVFVFDRGDFTFGGGSADPWTMGARCRTEAAEPRH